jgi:hypothetical protein
MVKWLIFYGDGSTFSSNDGSPACAPARDVQVIVQVDKRVGIWLQSTGDYYIFDGKWRSVDIFGLFDYLIEPGYKVVKFGRTISNDEYQVILRRAQELMEIAKSAYLPGERKSA